MNVHLPPANATFKVPIARKLRLTQEALLMLAMRMATTAIAKRCVFMFHLG